jgi:hypothetical protein
MRKEEYKGWRTELKWLFNPKWLLFIWSLIAGIFLLVALVVPLLDRVHSDIVMLLIIVIFYFFSFNHDQRE